MFWERFYNLCIERHTKPLPVVKELSIATGSITKWKNGTVPNGTTLQKISDYFGVSVGYLLGEDAKEKEPTVSTTVDPRLLSLIDSMTDEELADLEKYAEFILSKKKGTK